jgi:hypothetical protein
MYVGVGAVLATLLAVVATIVLLHSRQPATVSTVEPSSPIAFGKTLVAGIQIAATRRDDLPAVAPLAPAPKDEFMPTNDVKSIMLDESREHAFAMYMLSSPEPQKAISILNSMAAKERLLESATSETSNESRFITKYNKEFGDAFDGFSSLSFFNNNDDKKSFRPIRLLLKDGKIVVLVTRIVSIDVFNTLKLQPKQRASRTVQDAILPNIGQLTRFQEIKDVGFGGMWVGYGSKDFSKEFSNDLSADSEQVLIISPMRAIVDYDNKTTTDDAFLEASDVYMVDKDIHISKVKLTLE